MDPTPGKGAAFKFRAPGVEAGCRFGRRRMELQVPDVPLLKIFSFLDAFSLLQASQVNRVNAPHNLLSVGSYPHPSTSVAQTPLRSAPPRRDLGDPSLRPPQAASPLTFTVFWPVHPAPTDPAPWLAAAAPDRVAGQRTDALGVGEFASFALRASCLVKRKRTKECTASLC